MNITAKQVSLGLVVLLLSLLLIVVATLFWQHGLHIQASITSGIFQLFPLSL